MQKACRSIRKDLIEKNRENSTSFTLASHYGRSDWLRRYEEKTDN